MLEWPAEGNARGRGQLHDASGGERRRGGKAGGKIAGGCGGDKCTRSSPKCDGISRCNTTAWIATSDVDEPRYMPTGPPDRREPRLETRIARAYLSRAAPASRNSELAFHVGCAAPFAVVMMTRVSTRSSCSAPAGPYSGIIWSAGWW